MPELQSARDELDIQRVHSDYAWACDNADWGLLKSLFTDDAHLDYASSDGPIGPRDEVVAWLEESLSQVRLIQHVVSNFQIDLDGDRADVQAMFYTTVRLPGFDDDDLLLTGGYYQVEVVRTSGGWKFQKLIEDNRWMRRPTGGLAPTD